MKPKTSYQIMTSILTSYQPTYTEKQLLNSFFMCRYMANHPGSIFVSNFINRYYNYLPLNIQYDFAKQVLRDKIKFIQPPRKEKFENKIANNISRFYKVSNETALEYMTQMPKTELDKFEILYDGA